MNQNQDKEFENLFKRAAEHYPLDTDSADWDSVLSRLNEKEERKPFAFFNRRNTTVLLLLLAVGIISSLVTGLIVWNKAGQQNNNSLIKKKIPAADSITGREKKIADQVYRKVIESLENGQRNSTTDQLYKQEITSQQQQQTSMRRKQQAPMQRQQTPVQQEQAPTPITAKKMIAPQQDAVMAEKNAAVRKDTAAQQITGAATGLRTDSVAKDLATDSIAQAPNLKKEKKKATPGSKNFYAGILYAQDKSSIGFESNKGQGYSWQFLAGYRLGKRWSIESGIHIEKKEYYTTGTHTNKAVLNPEGTILWIESESRLLEIPLTVKYDALLKQKHSLFASAGVSSYIINREDFEYEEEVYGVIQKSSVAFTKATGNLFSTINFSLGYQYKFGKIGSIRIEPYINLPVSGIGKGESPIISRGIYAGWVYDFHKRKLKQ
ncbi:MAG: outer membrane beta-barrel protein [Sphingobacteriia bacterium]|nr:outer membrane beta-barrel protein [Sphingobacteriia bacterium]